MLSVGELVSVGRATHGPGGLEEEEEDRRDGDEARATRGKLLSSGSYKGRQHTEIDSVKT